MKLIHVKQARCVWLIDLQDLNPKGKDVIGDIVPWLKEAYNFAVAPDLDKILSSGTKPPTAQDPATALPSAGLAFQRGSFQVREDSFVEITSFTIYNDGVVVDTTSSTQDGDLFLSDVLQSAAKEFGLTYESELIRRKMYLSTLVVRSDVSLSAAHQGLAAWAEKIAPLVGNGSPPFKFAGLAFWTEPNDGGVHRSFSFLPQAGKSFSERRFFSEAPLRTEDHYRLLEELEQVLQKV